MIDKFFSQSLFGLNPATSLTAIAKAVSDTTNPTLGILQATSIVRDAPLPRPHGGPYRQPPTHLPVPTILDNLPDVVKKGLEILQEGKSRVEKFENEVILPVSNLLDQVNEMLPAPEAPAQTPYRSNFLYSPAEITPQTHSTAKTSSEPAAMKRGAINVEYIESREFATYLWYFRKTALINKIDHAVLNGQMERAAADVLIEKVEKYHQQRRHYAMMEIELQIEALDKSSLK